MSKAGGGSRCCVKVMENSENSDHIMEISEAF